MVAAVALAVLVLATRAMHLDGLADTADGLSAGYDRERALEVMRRGDIGPSGVAAVTLVLLVDVAALASLLPSLRGGVLAAVALLSSRQLLAWACARGVPSARADGLGATVAGTVTPPLSAAEHRAVAAVSTGAALAGRPGVVGGAGGPRRGAGRGWPDRPARRPPPRRDHR